MPLETLAVALAGLALLLYLGAGLCLWLPRDLNGYRWLAAPWAGYCLLVVITQFLTNSPLALTSLQSAYVAVGLATVVNALAAWRWRTSEKGREPGATNTGREVAWVWLVALGVFVLGVLPLWSYGYTTIIGENWDAEIYLGLGEYLKAYPQTGLAHALPNPILDTLINPPYSLRTHGFSYFQAALGFLPFDSLHTLAPLLALVRSLSIPAAYLFYRLSLRLGSRVSLPACVALGLNAFLLWVTYNTFGMQVPAFGLLPLAVCFTLLILRDALSGGRLFGARSPVWWTGLVLAAIAVTYHPALTAYLAMAGPAVLVALLVRRSAASWGRVLAAVASAGAVGILLSLVSQLKSFEGFLKQYSEKVGGLGLTGFTSPADAFGFSLSFRDLLSPAPGRPLLSLVARTYEALGWLALLVALALAGYYLWTLLAGRDTTRRLALEQSAFILGAVIYVLLFLRPLNYPYGWFKALTFVSFVPIGLSVAGLARLFGIARSSGSYTVRPQETTPALPRSRPRLAAGMAAGLVLVVPTLITLWLTVGKYWGTPLRYDLPMLQVGDIRPIVLAGADRSVYVSDSPNMQRLGQLYNGLLSYFLRDTELYGKFQTANSSLDRLRPNGLYHYLLLNAEDSPSEFGASRDELAWHNSLMSLYATPAEVQSVDLYHHNFFEDGKYPAATSGGTDVQFRVSSDGLDFKNPGSAGGLSDAGGEPLQFSLGLASLVTTTLHIEYGDRVNRRHAVDVGLPPGYTVYRSPSMVVSPDTVDVSVAGGTPGTSVYVRWAHLERYEGAAGQESGVSSDGPGLVATVDSSRQGDNLTLSVGYLNNKPESASLTQTLSLDVYSSGQSSHYGYWNFDVPPGKVNNLNLTLDAGRKALVSSSLNGQPVRPSAAFNGSVGDGNYVASLLVYENGQVFQTFNDIFTFTIKGGRLVDFRPRSLPPLFR